MLIFTEKTNAPPLYMPDISHIILSDNTEILSHCAPSSGVMVSVKLSRSAGSGKCVFIVEESSNSVRSVWYVIMRERYATYVQTHLSARGFVQR